MARDEPLIDAANSLCFVSVRLGVRPIGSLGLSGTVLSRQTIEAIGTLVAIAMEHARAVEQLGQTEAARQGEQLRTALLDAVTHALRTPLTSIKASVTNLLSNRPGDLEGIAESQHNLNEDQRRELLTIINEESDRLNRLVGEAGEMARLDAGEVELKLASSRIPVDDVIAAALGALQDARSATARFRCRIEIPAGLPRVRVDVGRAREVLTQLIENANQYSAPDQPITITAEANGDFVAHQRGRSRGRN